MLGVIPDGNFEKWQTLGFSILSLQHQIYNIIPDFPSKHRGQLLALSNNIIKEERFHNDVILSRGEAKTELEFLQQIKSNVMVVADATITPEKILKIILKNYVAATLEHLALVFSRQADAHNVGLKKMILYD